MGELVASLSASPTGLSTEEAARRLTVYGPNVIAPHHNQHVLRLLLRQFGSPIVLLLMAAAILSVLLHDATDGAIILGIVVASGLIGFWQEINAANIVATLVSKVELKTVVLRDGAEARIPLREVVPGDVVVISGGDAIPADCRVLSSRDLFVNEAGLTGESFPVEKSDGDLARTTPLARRTNALFMGTHAVSGTARALVVGTGAATEFGMLAARLRIEPAPTEFERGLRHFGYFLAEVTLLVVTAIFALNVYLEKPVLDSFLFALALAVGLTPQLLPAIIGVNLAKGAKNMAARRVVVKRLTAIENFGSMDVLCSDKTGTLTDGRVRFQAAVDAIGRGSERVWLHAYVNARLQTGYANPIDDAICGSRDTDVSGWTKLDEIPYDFTRRRLSVLASDDEGPIIISKGAVASVLNTCSHAEAGSQSVPIDQVQSSIRSLQASLESNGGRTLAVALRRMQPGVRSIRTDDEHDMTFAGIVVLRDPPKAGADRAIALLADLGVSLKMITGDSAGIAQQVAQQVGMVAPVVLTGDALQHIDDDALAVQADRVTVFAEIEPGQKERIIRALQRRGHVVGYMGDGINDAAALHTADVSISVQDGADAAKAAADIVLLEQDLCVLEQGVRDGRRTFANTMKYVFMATSANFGNMFSMAGASVFLTFLPLLPKQILLLNVLTDLPELTIATDRVEPDWIAQPRRWDVRFIRRFMIVFGVLSSVFDYLTFGVLSLWLHATPVQFRSGWFLESIVSATLIVLVIRTRGSMFTIAPSRALALTTMGTIVAAVIAPYSPVGRVLGFTPMSWMFAFAMSAIVLLYVAAAEATKRVFYRSAAVRR